MGVRLPFAVGLAKLARGSARFACHDAVICPRGGCFRTSVLFAAPLGAVLSRRACVTTHGRPRRHGPHSRRVGTRLGPGLAIRPGACRCLAILPGAKGRRGGAVSGRPDQSIQIRAILPVALPRPSGRGLFARRGP